MSHEHYAYWMHGKVIPSCSPAPKVTVTLDTTVSRLAYEMKREADEACIHAQRLEQLCERAAAKDAAATCDLSETMRRMQEAIDNAVRMLCPEPVDPAEPELKPLAVVRIGSQQSLKVARGVL